MLQAYCIFLLQACLYIFFFLVDKIPYCFGSSCHKIMRIPRLYKRSLRIESDQIKIHPAVFYLATIENQTAHAHPTGMSLREIGRSIIIARDGVRLL